MAVSPVPPDGVLCFDCEPRRGAGTGEDNTGAGGIRHIFVQIEECEFANTYVPHGFIEFLDRLLDSPRRAGKRHGDGGYVLYQHIVFSFRSEG